MTYKEHLNNAQFNDVLFHGSTDRYGVLKRGDLIVPGSHLGVEQHHNSDTYPDAGEYAHATNSYDNAWGYADWAALGEHYNQDGSKVRPITYMVQPTEHGMEDDPCNESGGVRSKHGFRVVGEYQNQFYPKDINKYHEEGYY